MATKKSTAPAKAQSRSEVIPSREVIEGRTEDARTEVFRAQGIIKLAADRLLDSHEKFDANDADAVGNALEAATAVLTKAAHAMDYMVLLAPAEAQGVAHV